MGAPAGLWDRSQATAVPENGSVREKAKVLRGESMIDHKNISSVYPAPSELWNRRPASLATLRPVSARLSDSAHERETPASQ